MRAELELHANEDAWCCWGWCLGAGGRGDSDAGSIAGGGDSRTIRARTLKLNGRAWKRSIAVAMTVVMQMQMEMESREDKVRAARDFAAG